MTVSWLICKYHQVMIWYYGWKMRRLIRHMRYMGHEYGLPPLDQWTDEQIIKAILLYHHNEQN